jgi:hypothetical protein
MTFSGATTFTMATLGKLAFSKTALSMTVKLQHLAVHLFYWFIVLLNAVAPL